MDKSVNSLLSSTIDKVKEMVNVDTVIGTPITSDGVTIIPVSKVAYGVAGGGSDLPSKSNSKLFGGGSGAGVTVTPIAFLTIKDGKVDLMPLITQPGPVDSLITKLPGAIDQLTTDFARRREEKAAKEAE